MWYVYLLLCDQKTFYIGITNNLRNRIIQHKSKLTTSTVEFSDINLVYCEEYLDKHQAAIREKQLKGWSRAKKQMLLDGILGRNNCTEFAVSVLLNESTV